MCGQSIGKNRERREFFFWKMKKLKYVNNKYELINQNIISNFDMMKDDYFFISLTFPFTRNKIFLVLIKN